MTREKLNHIPDWDDADLPQMDSEIRDRNGFKSSLMVPLMRGDDCVGSLGFIRTDETRLFAEEIADRQIVL